VDPKKYSNPDHQQAVKEGYPPLAIAALAFGLASGPCCACYGIPSLPLGILACIFGLTFLGRVRRGTVPPRGKWLARLGVLFGVLGGVGSVVLFVFVLPEL